MDYEALAKQFGGAVQPASVDYDALAKQYGGQLETPSEIPGARKQPTLTERVVGSFPARIAVGAATPFVGAFQLGANIGDYVNEKMGQKPVVGKAVADWWNNIQAMQKRGMEPVEQALGFEAGPDIAGTVAATVSTAAASGPLKAAKTVGKMVEGAKLGAAAGALTPGASSLEESAKDAAIGATVGSLAPVLIPPAAKAAGWVWDAMNGKLVQIKAGKVLREVAGEKLDALKAALAAAPKDLNAAQAAYGVDRDVWQALGEYAKNKDVHSYYRVLADAQEAARQSALKSVTPDLAAAEAAREAAAKANYGRAFASDVQRLEQQAAESQAGRLTGAATGYQPPAAMPSSIVALKGDPALDAAAKVAKTLRPGLGDPMQSLEGLHLMKVAIDNQFKNRLATTPLQNYSDAALQAAKTRLLTAIEGSANEPGLSPLYGLARKQYAAMSPEVNQAKVLGEMMNTLRATGGEERVQPFLNALGRGETALLKRADQSARFGGLQDVLTKPQMTTVQDIANQMIRDADMARMARAGRGGLSGILKEDLTSAVQAPQTLSRTSTIINAVAKKLQGRVSDNTTEAIVQGMRSGQNALELLNAIPTKERSLVLKTLMKTNAWVPQVTPTTINALRGEQESQNALAR